MNIGRVTTIAVAISAVTSLSLMLRASRHQRSVFLVLLFGMGAFAVRRARLGSSELEAWLPFARAVLYGLTVAVVFTCPIIYADVAFGRTTLKMGFVFLVVPFVCLLIIGLLVSTGLLSSRKASRVVDGGR